MKKLILLLLSTGLWVGSAQASLPAFVGCPADEMRGPVPAPAVAPALPKIPPGASGPLARYAAAGLAVLAPRGWHCIEMYGSGGAFLLVTPRLYTTMTLAETRRLVGPAVELTFLNGENSGREAVAAAYSRLFPFKRKFIRDVANLAVLLEEPPSRYPRGPFPSDTTLRRGRAEVDYTTPPHHDGMGTFANNLAPGARPIDGAAMLARSNGMDSVILLNVRLSRRQRALAPVILGSIAAAQDSGDGRRPVMLGDVSQSRFRSGGQ